MPTNNQILDQNRFFSSFSGERIRSYSFGFNGQEKLNEAYGEGNAYSFEYRIHDPRLGRFLSVDPLTKHYSYQSPYVYCENRVIDGIDIEGLEYITFLVRIYKDGTIEITQEHNYMNDQAAIINGQPRELFYQQYSQSFGDRGRGVEYHYQFFDENKNMVSETWEMGWDQKSKLNLNDIQRHGLFTGSGAATVLGPKGEGSPYQDYNWGLNPIDQVDAIAKVHDLAESGPDFTSWLDTKYAAADIILIKQMTLYLDEVMKGGYIDPFTGRPASQEAVTQAYAAKNFFTKIVGVKIASMQEKYAKNEISWDEYKKFQDDVTKAYSSNISLPGFENLPPTDITIKVNE